MWVPTLVLSERRGPRAIIEFAAHEKLFATEEAWPFGWREASIAADLYRRAARPGSREVDLALTATQGEREFMEPPGLSLNSP